MKKVPFYKKKWFTPSRIQRDLIIYVICISILSQLVVTSHIMAVEGVVGGKFASYAAFLIKILFVAVLIYGLLLTNRIAGPLFRLKQHMDEVAEGKVEAEIRFRKNDYGLEIAEAFNAVVKKRFK
jgi:methyl-accepting chemotaxis protein